MDSFYGHAILTLVSGNTWIISGTIQTLSANTGTAFMGSIGLSGTLDRLRLTTVNGTDTFDAGSVNLLLEG